MRRWLAFVAGDEPDTPGEERWPTFQKSPDTVLEFVDVVRVTDRPSPDTVDFWLSRAG
ncbi:hypothetical protein [Rathayibacter sp. VKM Ac-2927]|uniref:hypothetical protein n=1 Tax=Rathayibacter sp. VKM Ac-2927 TaxID=2929478 RepID=UPI001FB40403|nr:hypothetical protein [Rathayibacter sp. VKM Ac-2927]MCJ1687489.1 hypothetical protein [Rathayibacter sp. VKM Ac-2927]